MAVAMGHNLRHYRLGAFCTSGAKRALGGDTEFRSRGRLVAGSCTGSIRHDSVSTIIRDHSSRILTGWEFDFLRGAGGGGRSSLADRYGPPLAARWHASGL